MSVALWVNTQVLFLLMATALFQGHFYAGAQNDFFFNLWQLYDSYRISVLVFFLFLFPAESQGIFI